MRAPPWARRGVGPDWHVARTVRDCLPAPVIASLADIPSPDRCHRQSRGCPGDRASLDRVPATAARRQPGQDHGTGDRMVPESRITASRTDQRQRHRLLRPRRGRMARRDLTPATAELPVATLHGARGGRGCRLRIADARREPAHRPGFGPDGGIRCDWPARSWGRRRRTVWMSGRSRCRIITGWRGGRDRRRRRGAPMPKSWADFSGTTRRCRPHGVGYRHFCASARGEHGVTGTRRAWRRVRRGPSFVIDARDRARRDSHTRTFLNCHGSDLSRSSGNSRSRSCSGVQSV